VTTNVKWKRAMRSGRAVLSRMEFRDSASGQDDEQHQNGELRDLDWRSGLRGIECLQCRNVLVKLHDRIAIASKTSEMSPITMPSVTP